ncbi:MAG: FlgD immunoglobulin-like domain containing protein [Spirochaetia bacterium]|nr:T9SS type A sorting domain-containing protein [Spirochaetota bacterium]MDW8112140.1 FlgD immunoglobulin-like domain containing protein [Spirochaetia bacterium]
MLMTSLSNKVLLVLMFVFLSYHLYGQITFYEDFNTAANISSFTANLTNGTLEVGYPDVTSGYYWFQEWGDFAYYNGNFYIVWADRRYDGYSQVFLTKMDGNGNILFSTNIEISMIATTNSNEYYNFAISPTISVYDNNHIYISFGYNFNNFYRTIASRWQDTGSSFSLVWSRRVDNNFGDQIDYTPILYKASSTVDNVGNLYLIQVWRRIGSGDTSWISKIDSSGNQYWISGINPGTAFMTTFGDFIIAGEVIYTNGFIYATGQHWIWSPSRDFGVGINRLSTNNTYSTSWGGGTNISGRGVVFDYMLHAAPKVDLVYLSGDLYIVFADRRNGNSDVFITRINTNTGFFVWSSPSVRLVAGGSDVQEYPSIHYDGSGNLYVSYLATSGSGRSIRVAKVDQNGSVLGDVSLDSALYNPTYNIGQPKLYVSPSGELFVFFYEDGGVGKRRVKVAKYDGFAGNLLFVKEVQDVEYKKVSSMLSTRVLAGSVGTASSVRLNSTFATNGQQINFFTSPDGINWYLTPTNTVVNFTNIGSDLRVRITFSGDGKSNFWVDSYSLEVLGYQTGDIFASTNSNFTTYVGSNYISSALSSQIITNYVLSDGVNKAVFHLRLLNIGNSSGNFYLYGSFSKSWSYDFFDANNNNIKPQVNNGTYGVSLLPGQFTNFRLEITPPSSSYDGEIGEFYLYTSATNGNYQHDAMTLVVYARKYLPDMAISNASGVIGTNVYELHPSSQSWSAKANSRFYGYETAYTNYIRIFNRGILNDVIAITNNFSSSIGSLSDWNILVSNISDNQLVSSYPYYLNINSGQNKVLMVVVSPKTNATTNDILSLRFFSFSTNTNAINDNLRKDSVMFVITNHKVQPDVVVSTNIYMLGGVNEGNYVSTNTTLTQSIMVRTVNNVGLTYYFRVKNDGYQPDTIFVKAQQITNPGWSERYYTNDVEITSSITNAGINVYLQQDEWIDIKAEYTPDGTVDSGVEPWVRLDTISTTFTNAYDYAWARPRNIKVRPDVLIGSSLSSMIGNDIYNSTGMNQNTFNLVMKGGVEIVTNFIVVQNDSTTDPDIINIVGDVQPTGWIVKYLSASDDDITHNITNTTNLTLPLGSSITLKVVSYPQMSVPDDQIVEIKVKAYSSYVASQEDVVVVSNRAISVKPDMGVWAPLSGWIDVPTVSGTYEGQGSLSNKIIAGMTNSFRIRLKNDTLSVQPYILKATITNKGGSLKDWVYTFRSVVGSLTNDITSHVTNNGWTNTYSVGQTVEVLVSVFLTNAVSFDLATTNGAVSNMLELKYDFISVFRTNIVDKGMHSLIVVRGLPDAYHESLLVGLNIVTNEFGPGNYSLYGITKNYPRSDIVLKFRNVGDFRDVFRIYATISNGSQPNNHITNWVFSFFDEQTNDVTYYITNTNAGWTNTITNGYERILRMQIVNSNGYVNDNVFFFFSFETVTKEVRFDTIWYEVIITPGLPDVAVSNIYTGTLKGTNQFGPESYDYYKIETNEIGRYRIVMRNIAPIQGYPRFRLKAVLYGDTGKFDIYHTNKDGNYIHLTNLTSTLGYTNYLSNYNAINNFPEDYLSVYVVPKPSALPGDKVIIRYEFSLYDNPGVFDFVYITNQVVIPRVSVLSLPTYSSNVTAYVGKYQSSTGMFIVSNGDSVWEDFVVKATQSSSVGWNIKFFTNSTDLSSSFFGTGFETGNIDGNTVMLFTFTITNTTELTSGTTNILSITARSKKNTNVSSTLTVNILYIDAVADIFARNEDDNGEFVGINVIDGAITNKIEINETNIYYVVLSNSISVGAPVKFVVSAESNYSPMFITRIFSHNDTDITSQVFNSNYIIEIGSGQSSFVRVVRILTNTNTSVGSGFHSYLRLSMKTVDVENNIYDYIILRDVVVDPDVDVRSAGGYDNIFSFNSYLDNGKNVKTFKNTPISVYLGIKNEDQVSERFYVKANTGNSVWDVKYYDLNNNDVTDLVRQGSYLTPLVGHGEFYIIKTVIKPSIEVNPADVFYQTVEVWSYKNNSRKDFITNTVSIESMFIVGKVRDKKTGNGIPNSVVEVVDPYGMKVVVKSDTNGNYSAPVYPVVGGLYMMKAEASAYVGAFTNIYFEIGTNIVNFDLVGLNMTADKVDVRIFPNPIQVGKGGSFVYALNEDTVVSVSIYDLNGKLVKHIARDERKPRGVYYFIWDGTDENGAYVKQGVYVFTINTGKEVIVKKLFVK